MTFRNRIIGEGVEAPEDLLANPMNHRIHPEEQNRALEGALKEIGWVQRVIVNQRSGHIIDGHARVKLAMRRSEREIPVVYVDLDENEERIILAALDAVTNLAGVDDEMLAEILRSVDVQDEDLAAFLDSLLQGAGDEDPEGDDDPRVTLAERFLVPPFSVLDGRAGYWLDRKRAWLQLGIKSELGRGDDLTYGVSCQPPEVHDRKRAIEETDGQTYSWNQFAEKYPDEIKMAGTSIFDPVLTEVAYRWFAPAGGKVLDPFAGGSVRGVVASMLGLEYTGIDLRAEQIEANRTNWNKIGVGGGLKARQTPDDHTPDQTPIEAHGEAYAKRDDLFVFAGSRGGKVRSCLALSEGAPGLVTAGSRHSPQANIVAGIAAAKGIPARVHVPSGELTDELRAAQAAGAEIIQHRPGYNSVIVARAREDAAERGWTEIPFGMECQEAVEQTRRQVEPLPPEVQRIVVAVGSGMSLAGILHGLADTGQNIPVLGIMVGADPKKRLDQYAPRDWKDRVTLKKAGTPYDQPARDTTWNGIPLDPHYEAKAAPHVQAGDLFWIVGRRQSAEPTEEATRGAPGETAPRWIAGDSLDLDTHLRPDERFDLVFTCPPYGDLEVYSDDPRDISGMEYQQFIAIYREIIARACTRLRDNRFAVCVVGEIRGKDGGYRNFVGDTIEAFEAAGLRYYNEAIYVTPAGSLALRAANYFTASRKLGKGHQQALVFAKGTPDLGTPEGVAEAITQAFTEERQLLTANRKLLVFAKGSPQHAAQDLGVPDMADPIEHWALDQVDSPGVDA